MQDDAASTEASSGATTSASADRRPRTAAEKERFSSGGQRHRLLLRGRWGLAIDTAILWLTGYSLMTRQYTVAMGAPYQETLLLYTTGAKTGKRRLCGLPFFTVDGDRIVMANPWGPNASYQPKPMTATEFVTYFEDISVNAPRKGK